MRDAEEYVEWTVSPPGGQTWQQAALNFYENLDHFLLSDTL